MEKRYAIMHEKDVHTPLTVSKSMSILLMKSEPKGLLTKEHLLYIQTRTPQEEWKTDLKTKQILVN